MHLDTERGWRGGERQAFWLARELRARGHRSIVAARPEGEFFAAAHAEGIETWPTSPRFEVDPLAAWRLAGRIIDADADIVHAHTAHAVGLGALATLRTHAALVATRRVDFPLRRNAGTRWKYDRVAGLIAISSAVRDVLVASGIVPERIAVVPSGVDLTRTIVPAPAATLGALGVRLGAPLVVMVAALVPHKAPLTFVRAIAAAVRDADLQALLVGDGPLAGEVRRERDTLGLGGVLHLAGQRSDADALIAACDVFVLSSREEGLGTVLLDAMSCGKPVAATSAGGIGDVVKHGVTGLLVPVGEAAALGAAIAGLCGDAGRRAAMGEAGRVGVSRFGVEQMAEGTLGVYRRALGR
ncbi:MAG: glycosyltransferase family 4 protein [Gemmatimonadota bacterium]